MIYHAHMFLIMYMGTTPSVLEKISS